MYASQKLDFEFYLVDRTKPFSDGSVIKRIIGPRSEAMIPTTGGIQTQSAKFKIWGLSHDDMATLTQFYGWFESAIFNRVVVRANGLVVYQGTITNSQGNFNSVPDSYLEFEAVPCAFLMTNVSPAYSANGAIKIDDIIKAIIEPFNMSLVNLNVDKFINDPYLEGSAYNKLTALLKSVNVWAQFNYNTMVIFLPNSIDDAPPINLNSMTGLIGYPMYVQNRLKVKTFFNPSARVTSRFNLTSSVPFSNGIYTPVNIVHNLTCNIPGGVFETQYLLQKRIINENAS